MSKTLLAIFSHPDDEVGCAGTLAAHAAMGHRVVMVFLTRGEMTEALGPLSAEEIGRLRVEHAQQAGRLLGAEIRFLDYQDTRIEVTVAANHEVARLIAEIKPHAILTWGSAWVRGMRHPDHQATGDIVRNAATLARIARVVRPLEPHREAAPIFSIRDHHSTLPAVAIDVSQYVDQIFAVGDFYRERVGFPPAEWLSSRTLANGRAWGVEAAEAFDAYETTSGLFRTLFEPSPLGIL